MPVDAQKDLEFNTWFDQRYPPRSNNGYFVRGTVRSDTTDVEVNTIPFPLTKKNEDFGLKNQSIPMDELRILKKQKELEQKKNQIKKMKTEKIKGLVKQRDELKKKMREENKTSAKKYRLSRIPHWQKLLNPLNRKIRE